MCQNGEQHAVYAVRHLSYAEPEKWRNELAAIRDKLAWALYLLVAIGALGYVAYRDGYLPHVLCVVIGIVVGILIERVVHPPWDHEDASARGKTPGR